MNKKNLINRCILKAGDWEDRNNSLGKILADIWRKMPNECKPEQIGRVLAMQPEFLSADLLIMDDAIRMYYKMNDDLKRRLKTYACKDKKKITLDDLPFRNDMRYCVRWIFNTFFPDDYAIVEEELRGNLKIEFSRASTVEKGTRKRAITQLVEYILEETKSNLTVEAVMSRMKDARLIDDSELPLVKKGKLYFSTNNIVVKNIRYCEYCSKGLPSDCRSDTKYHENCRSERSHRLENLKKLKKKLGVNSVSVKLSNDMYGIIKDVKKGIFIIQRPNKTYIEGRDRRSKRSDLPYILKYL